MKVTSPLKVLIPAAGKGSRSRVHQSKTLTMVGEVPIIVRLVRTVRELDPWPAIVVSPEGKEPIAKSLHFYGLSAELLVQETPLGMGDAVLQLKQSGEYYSVRDVLVIWGDQPFVQIKTLRQLVTLYTEANCALAFPSIMASDCYTCVVRDSKGEVINLLERREIGETLPRVGEKDAGIFLFAKKPVMKVLSENAEQLRGKSTGEKGFLAVVGILVERGYSVKAWPIATELDICGFNTPEDLQKMIELSGQKPL